MIGTREEARRKGGVTGEFVVDVVPLVVFVFYHASGAPAVELVVHFPVCVSVEVHAYFYGVHISTTSYTSIST
jgi:hypothetical protein